MLPSGQRKKRHNGHTEVAFVIDRHAVRPRTARGSRLWNLRDQSRRPTLQESSKTETMLVLLKWIISDDEEALKFANERLMPSLRLCPPVAKQIPDDRTLAKSIESMFPTVMFEVVGGQLEGLFPVRYKLGSWRCDWISACPCACPTPPATLKISRLPQHRPALIQTVRSAC